METQSMEDLFAKLLKSKFRRKFHLNDADFQIIDKKGLDLLWEETKLILQDRVSVLKENDGMQTPFKGHPCFVGQHALGLCCRNCIEKWHGIPKELELEENHLDYFADLLLAWYAQELLLRTENLCNVNNLISANDKISV
jgi:exodeoxyribonuclease V alpha subunit